MNLNIENFGKIAEADINLDGITVICGNNNSGKSTVGKALFSYFNSFYDYENKIIQEKTDTIVRFIISCSYHSPLNSDYPTMNQSRIKNYTLEYVSNHKGEFTKEELREYLNNLVEYEAEDEKLENLVKNLNTDDGKIIALYAQRYFGNIMNGQIINMYSPDNAESSLSVNFKNHNGKVNFNRNNGFSCRIRVPIVHEAYYICNPFIIDCLNSPHSSLRYMSTMEKKAIESILDAQLDINDNSMANILDSIGNQEVLDEVIKILKQAYTGTTKIVNQLYYYNENDKNFDIRNISAGLKSFALIERMLETGVLKRNDVLILDEPEIHLHTEWQIIYAELIVLLQKKFDLTILIATHSFQFLESLDFFMKKHGISDKGNYYLPEATDNGVIMKSCGNDALELKKNLTTGSVMLSNIKFEYEMENYSEEDN